MILAIASGKGGTGKTTVSVNLARAMNTDVHLLDCDVEEPDAHLFLKGRKVLEEDVCIPVPRVKADLCDGCNACGTFCAYNAIASFGKAPIVFKDMCHGCGGCMKVCPRGALEAKEHRIGIIETFEAGPVTLVQGKLDVGAPMAPPLIRAVKSLTPMGRTVILDAPPGTSCPVMAALRNVDFVVLVTEPTPFGLHDLTLAVDMVRELELPHGAVINRADGGDKRVHEYCAGQGIPVLLEIPDDRRIAETYSRGELIVDALPAYQSLFEGFLETVDHVMAGKGV